MYSILIELQHGMVESLPSKVSFVGQFCHNCSMCSLSYVLEHELAYERNSTIEQSILFLLHSNFIDKIYLKSPWSRYSSWTCTPSIYLWVCDNMQWSMSCLKLSVVVEYPNDKSYCRSTRLTNRFFHFLPRIDLRTSVNMYRTIEDFFLRETKHIHCQISEWLISHYFFLDSSLSHCWPSISFALSDCMYGVIDLELNENDINRKKSPRNTIRWVRTVFDRVSDVHVSTFEWGWTCIGWWLRLENDLMGFSVSCRHVSIREWGSIWIGRSIGF